MNLFKTSLKTLSVNQTNIEIFYFIKIFLDDPFKKTVDAMSWVTTIDTDLSRRRYSLWELDWFYFAFSLSVVVMYVWVCFGSKWWKKVEINKIEKRKISIIKDRIWERYNVIKKERKRGYVNFKNKIISSPLKLLWLID